MGICDINNTLKKYAPSSFLRKPLKNFRGKAIGIDASLWAYKAKSSAMKDVVSKFTKLTDTPDPETLISLMRKQFYGFIDRLTTFDITPVWIFDGETHPAKLAVDLRKKAKQAQKKSLEEKKEEILQMDILDQERAMPKYRASLIACSPPTRDEINMIKESVDFLGLPKFTAPYDAEIYASKLSELGFLAAVWTTDTDTYATGANITITGFSGKTSEDGVLVDIVAKYYMLKELDITQEELTDLCILHGCDFNQRSKGFGPVSIINKLRDFDWNLDKLRESDTKIEWCCLNIDECRSIFRGDNLDVSDLTIEDFQINEKKWKSATKKIDTFELNLPSKAKMEEFEK